MYPVSQALAQALEGGPIRLRLRSNPAGIYVPPEVVLLEDVTGAPLLVLFSGALPGNGVEQNRILSLSYTAGCCSDDVGIGNVCAAGLSATVEGSLNLLDAAVTAELGAEVDGAVQWIPLGRFVVTECRRTDDLTTFTACDAAYYALGRTYVPTVQSGATAAAVLADLAAQCELTVETDTLALGTMSVNGSLTGRSCRELLGYLAGLCGRNCVVTRDGKLRFVWFSASETSVVPEDYYDGGLSNGGVSRLSGLVCSAVDADGEDITLTVGNADTAIRFDNPYMTQTQLNAIWADIGAWSYPFGTVDFRGGVRIEPGDVLSLTSREGVSIDFPVMELRLTLDGGCRCSVTSYGQAEVTRKNPVAGPLEQRLEQVEEAAVEAQESADEAMLSANGRNKVFHQSTAPQTAVGLTAGDLWFNTANDNQINTWTGSAWSAFELGEDAIADLSITNAKIANGTIQNAKIANLDAGKITSGTIDAARINTQSLFSSDVTIDHKLNINIPNDFIFSASQYGLNIKTFGENHIESGLLTSTLGDCLLHGDRFATVSSPCTQISGVNSTGIVVSSDIVLNGDVSVTNGSISGYCKALTVDSKSITISSVAVGNTDSGSVSAAKSGYTPIGIVGYTTGTDTGNSLFNVSRLYLDGSNIKYLVRNLHDSSSYGCTLTVRVLYVKN